MAMQFFPFLSFGTHSGRERTGSVLPGLPDAKYSMTTARRARHEAKFPSECVIWNLNKFYIFLINVLPVVKLFQGSLS